MRPLEDSVKPEARIKRIAVWLITRLVGLLVVINAVFYLQQPTMTFYPFSEVVETPKNWGLSYQDIELITQDNVRLHAWFIPHPEATHTLLFLHGNAGNISHRGESVEIFHRLGLNVLIFDYRGYGNSEGTPDEPGLYRDAEAAWAYLTQQRKIKPEEIIIFGRSLGGAVAVKLASQNTPAALILESTFSSARDMAREIFPILSRVVWMRYRFDSVSSVMQVKSPILFLHSPHDEIIPYRLGKKLFDAAPQPKQFVNLRGGHNGGFMMSMPEYERELRKFVKGIASMTNISTPD